jgi:hypothetical protein
MKPQLPRSPTARALASGGVLALLCLSLAACGGGKSEPAAGAVGIGRRVAAGEARALVLSADGAWLAWLDDCHVARGQYLPPGTANCTARVAPAGGGDAGKIAGAVTTLPQGLGWSRAGATLAALADYDYAAGTGTLIVWRDGAARELARDVTFHGFGPAGELGFVSGGRLSVLLPGDDAPRVVAGAEGVASLDFAPVACPRGADGFQLRLAARRSRDAGGQLLVVDCAMGPARAAVRSRVSDYGFSPSGINLAYTSETKGGPELHRFALEKGLLDVRVGAGVRAFAFSAEGEALAFAGDVAPGLQGNLYLAVPGQRAPVLLAKEVGDFRWAAKAPRIAWLERYDPRVRSGVLGVGGPGLAPRTFGRNVTDLDLSSDGKFVAFLQHTTRGGFSVDLGLVTTDAPAGTAPASVAHGVFGFAFSPDARWLYYRTRCTRNGEGCDLERVPAAGLAKDAKPELIAEGMKSFEFDPRDPARVLVGWQRMDRQALDLGVWQGGKLLRVDQNVLPGSARFLGPDSRRLGYAVIDPRRAGIYVAEP